MVAPEAACLNLQRLAADGLAGRLGLFEAIDYTPSRQRRGESSAVVRSFMAHHQAMSLLSCAYVLLARPMQKRFESDPLFQATLLLLQERIPRATLFHSHAHRSFRSPRGRGRPGVAGARAHQPGHGDSGGAVAVERPLPRDGHECRRREQPLERSGRDPLARRQHLRQLGHVLLSARRGERGVLVNRAISPRSSRRNTTRRSSRKAGRSFGAGISISRRIPRSWFRPKTTSRSAGSTSPTGPGLPGRSTSRATRRWFSRQRPRTHCIRRSAISSCKPRSSTSGAQFFAPGAHAPSKSRCRGCFI